ncbi:MAG: gamma-glutamyl-gamma-aminobutyrate hydrolase family protein [Bacteriovoracaceae bacterium]
MIKIGVTSCFFYPDPERNVYGKKTLSYMEMDTARYLSDHGVMPVLIPLLEGEQLKNFCDQLDGLVCQGGDDVCPLTYGDQMIEDGRWPGDAKRDKYELEIIDYFFKSKRPIFGICRGSQILNVYFGGTLYQDLTLETGTEVIHRDALAYDEIHHEVDFLKGGLLDEIYPGVGTTVINSVHHQGVKKLGKDLVVDAYSTEDKVVEGFHYKDLENHFVMAVQWHPEFSHTLGDKVIDPKPLMETFLKRVKTSYENR